jgi:hypothetical protein
VSEIYWLNPISGSFTNPSYWSGGVVPGPSDDAIIDAAGNRRYRVTSSVNARVNSIQTGPNATLAIAGGRFRADDGTGTGANAGIILVQPHAKLALGGKIKNSGSIVVGGSAVGAKLLLTSYTTRLSGGGQIELLGDGESSFGGTDSRKYAICTNIDNTISGSGTIGKLIGSEKGFDLINDSAGVIDANATSPLFVYGDTQNHGLVEATGSGGLTFEARNPSDGVFLAGNGSTMHIIGPQLDGATLESRGNGTIMAEYIFSDGLTNKSNLTLSKYNYFDGVIVNTNTISVENGSSRFIGSCTLSGGGTIDIESTGSMGITQQHSNVILTNVNNTTNGGGFIYGPSDDPLTIINEAQGIINGDGPSTFFIFTGATTVVNAGTIESTGAGGVNLWASLENGGLVVASVGTLAVGRPGETYNLANNGTIEAKGGGIVVIESAIGNSGTLSSQAGGTLTANGAVSGGGVAVVNVGTLDFKSSFDEAVIFGGPGELELAQSQAFNRSVTGFSGTGTTTLDLGDIGFVSPGEAIFSGNTSSGVLTVTDGTQTAKIKLEGDYLGSTFVASSDGNGGTDVIAETLKGFVPPPHAFISAMASFGGAAAGYIRAGETNAPRDTLLTLPRVQIA